MLQMYQENGDSRRRTDGCPTLQVVGEDRVVRLYYFLTDCYIVRLVSAIWWYPACRVVSGRSPICQDASAGLPADMNFYPVGQRERLRGFGTFKTKTLVNSREMISKKVSSDHEGPPVECRESPGSRQDTNKQKVG